MKKKPRYFPLPITDTNYTGSQVWELPLTLWELQSIIGANGKATPKEMEKFLQSLQAKSMPKKLRTEAEKWIKDNK